jgi:cytochrome P450
MVLTLEPWTPDYIIDPYPWYARMRPASPFRAEPGSTPMGSGSGAWALLKFEDCFRVLKDHETFSSKLLGGPGGGLVLIGDDQPRHTRMRHLVNKTFRLAASPSSSRGWPVAASSLTSSKTAPDVVDSFTVHCR